MPANRTRRPRRERRPAEERRPTVGEKVLAVLAESEKEAIASYRRFLTRTTGEAGGARVEWDARLG